MTALPSSITQIVYFTISPDIDLNDANSQAGKAWSLALDVLENSSGYQYLFWGRSVEQPAKVQLHIIRSSLSQHQSHLASATHRTFLEHISGFIDQSIHLTIRHVIPMTIYTSSPTTPFHAPVTGTAIYIRTTTAWHEGAWPCWTHIVRHVKGCTGIAGGKLLEPFDAEVSAGLAGASAPTPSKADDTRSALNPIGDCYLVYVGWETIKAHNDYHHTKHFRDHSVVLSIGNEGWREYGHVRFEGWRGEEGSAVRAEEKPKL